MVSLRMSLPSIDQNGILVLIHGNDYACSSIGITVFQNLMYQQVKKQKQRTKIVIKINQDSCNLYKIVLKVLGCFTCTNYEIKDTRIK